ncbi:MAG: hypothetical protein HYY17_13605 [Planctomycetes bacterium]|nr:hypothetical protein [Planctomycetota bacterium]
MNKREKKKRRNALNREFLAAVKKGDIQEVKRCLAGGADLESTTHQNRKSALLEAVSRGHDSIAELLIRRGADLGATDFRGRGALSLARDQGMRDLIARSKGTDYSFSDFRSYY